MEEFKAFNNANNDRQELLPQRGGRQGLLPQQGDQLHGLHDVSLPTEADKGCQGTLSQYGGLLNGSHDVYLLSKYGFVNICLSDHTLIFE